MYKRLIILIVVLMTPYQLFAEITMHRSNASAPIGDGWHLAVSEEGGFSIEVPSEFNDLSTVVKSTQSTVYVVGGKTENGIIFMATKSVLPNIIESKAAYEYLYQELKVEILQEDMKDNSFLAETEKKYTYIRVWVKREGTKMYALSFEYPKPMREIAIKQSERMFKSLRLKTKQ